MENYSQRDPRWKNATLGFSKTKIGSFGCKLTCYSIIDGRDPLTMNELFKKGEAFVGDLLYDKHCAFVLGWEATGTVYTDPRELCIAEVDFNPDPKKDQHFVVWLGDGRIIDPWNGLTMKNPYKVYSYRKLKIKEPKKTKEETMANEKNVEKVLKSLGKLTGDDYGKSPNDNETKRIGEQLEALSTKLTYQERLLIERERKITELGVLNVRFTKSEAETFKFNQELIGENASLYKQLKKLQDGNAYIFVSGEGFVRYNPKVNADENGYELNNSFQLGNWLFKIFTKEKK